jgi:hypothetical protein
MARKITKTERIIVRATPQETAMLSALSAKTGLSMSDVVRQLVRHSYAESFGDTKPRRPRR